MRGARAVAAAADRVQTASERDDREAAAPLPERCAGRPGAACLVVLVDGPQRGPAHAPAAVAADHEEPAFDDGGRGVVRGGGERGARLPTVGGGIVDLDRGDDLAVRAEAADHEHAAVELRDRDLLARGRHRGERNPLARTHDVDRRIRVGRLAQTAGDDQRRESQPDACAGASHARSSSSSPASSSTGTPNRRASSALLPGASPTTT